MHQITIAGDGDLGWAVAAAASERGVRAPVLGRPAGGRHDPAAYERTDVAVDASVGPAVRANLDAALRAGVRRFVIATTDWAEDRVAVDQALRANDAAAVASSNFSLGMALFARLVDRAAELFGAVDGFDPYLVEWHRRGKRDRPSATALDLGRRLVGSHPGLETVGDLEIVSIRAGASPGMHLVAFDSAGETVELRLTARDRSTYAVGILAAAEWLVRAPRSPGLHPIDPVVDELLARTAIAA